MDCDFDIKGSKNMVNFTVKEVNTIETALEIAIKELKKYIKDIEDYESLSEIEKEVIDGVPQIIDDMKELKEKIDFYIF
ncbi:hypothetical protein HYH68_18555 [Clostridium botulinum]|uniref:hypothetical protein n=1 Tax=Clostridium botulinum TaxID=1491 RepID=UPI001C9B99BE|nr:hypothetical protein [Clostridium botulinum]MBY6889757.1 hypothetical protein [Clostridium botulinum]MBY6889759.1 hypothetical protein [Clostridium botulinum]